MKLVPICQKEAFPLPLAAGSYGFPLSYQNACRPPGFLSVTSTCYTSQSLHSGFLVLPSPQLLTLLTPLYSHCALSQIALARSSLLRAMFCLLISFSALDSSRCLWMYSPSCHNKNLLSVSSTTPRSNHVLMFIQCLLFTSLFVCLQSVLL